MKIKLPQQADSIVNEGDRVTDIDTTSLSHNETHQPIVINIQNQNTNQKCQSKCERIWILCESSPHVESSELVLSRHDRWDNCFILVAITKT